MVVGTPRISTGIPGLDDILLGGWPANHLYLVEGPPGSGKTTMALQFLLAGARNNETVLYVTLAESKPELETVAASHGMDLEGVLIHEYTPNEDSLRKENEYSVLYPAEVEHQDTMQTILAKVDEIRPTRLVFDSLSETRSLARDPLRYRRQVLALKQFFLRRNTTVLMLDEPEHSHKDLQLQSLAHGVLSLQRVGRDYGVERRRLHIIKLRTSSFREGFHDYTIKRGGIEVYPRLVASEYIERQPDGLITSGIPKLDEMAGGGLQLGTATVFKGPAGCGKSTVTTKYVFEAISQGIPAAIFQFDETLAITLKRSKAMGMDLSPHIARGILELKQYNPAQFPPGEFIAHVRDAVENRGVKVVVIDTINGFLNAMAGEDRLLLQMHELCTYLNQRGVVTCLVLSQSGIVAARSPQGADLSYLADNIISFTYFEAFGEVRKALSVLKMRSSWHEPSIRELRFTEGRVSVGEPLGEFQGILSGTPAYTGSPALLDRAMREQPDPQ